MLIRRCLSRRRLYLQILIRNITVISDDGTPSCCHIYPFYFSHVSAS